MTRTTHRFAITAAVLLAATAASAAPFVLEASFRSPARAKTGELIVMMVEQLAEPVAITFNGPSGTSVPAVPIWVDVPRGMVAVTVPAGAVTGPLQLTAGGVSAPPHRFIVVSGTFDPGTIPVGGQVRADGVALPGAAVVLLRPPSCEEDEPDFWGAAVTDASGHYALTASAGVYQVMVFSPRSTGRATSAASLTVGASPVTHDVDVESGVPVTGRVIDPNNGGSPVANARVSFEYSGYDQDFTGADGTFDAFVAPGDGELRVQPPRGGRGIELELAPTLGPGPTDLGDLELASAPLQVRGFVRNAMGRPMPGAQVEAYLTEPCCSWVGETLAVGDGSYAINVASGGTYGFTARADRSSGLADASVGDVVIASADVVQDFVLVAAATISGTVVHAGSGDPLERIDVEAHSAVSRYWTRTCADGSYLVRVAPGADPYVVVAGNPYADGLVRTAWDGSADGTPFECEAGSISTPTAGSSVPGINLALATGATIAGRQTSQASGCTDPAPGWVSVDDGQSHQCSLGFANVNGADGTFSVVGLPPSSKIDGLRVCAGGYGVSTQCWDARRWPDFTPVRVDEGGTAAGIDFCLGNRPTREVTGLRVTKDVSTVYLWWDDSTDLYHENYALHGATSATPSSGSGNFPYDPSFPLLATTWGPSASIPASTPYTFFLVTDRGVTGEEGPSGHYE